MAMYFGTLNSKMCSNMVRLCFLFILFVSPALSTDYCVNQTTYSMTYTSSTEIDISTFGQCDKVTHVNVSHNEISRLGNDTFYLLWRIEVLDLSFNNLSEIGHETFSSLRQLKYLYITNNQLTTIPLDFFVNKLELVAVDLSHNNIADIPMEIFDHDMPKIKRVILQYNMLKAFEPWALYFEHKHQVIEYLDLRHNQISTFTNKYNYTYHQRSVYTGSVTDIRFNNLTLVDEDFYNQYKNKSEFEVSTVMAEVQVDIRNNSITCDCFMHPLAASVHESYFLWSEPDMLKVKCYNPPNLRGKEVFYDIRLTEFICVVTKDCPTGCNCEERPEAGVIHVECGDAKLENVPTALPVNPDYSAYELILNNNTISQIENVVYASKLVALDASNNRIDYISNKFVEGVARIESVKVDLRNNELSRIPKEFENIKYQNVKLGGNNFICDCDMLWMKTWINLAPKHTDKSLTCSYQGDIYKIIDIDENLLECSNLGNIIMVVFLSIGLAIVIGLIITAKRCPYATKVLIFKIFRIHPADNYEVDRLTGQEYDAYISYDEDDIPVRQWVERVLVKQLEGKNPHYKLFIGVRNKEAGPEADSRGSAMEKSRRLIIILSKDFINKDWCEYDAYTAETLERNRGRVIFILYDKVGAEIATREPWKSKTEDRKVFRETERMFWSKLRYEMPRKPVRTSKKLPERSCNSALYVIGHEV